MQGKLRGDEGHSFIGAVIASLVMVLISVAVFAGQAEMKKDKGGDDGKPKRIIRGKPENRRAVEALLEESEGDAEVEMTGAHDERVRKLKGKFRIDKNKPVEEAALDFIDRHRDAFGLKDAKRELKKEPGNSLHFQQVYNGVPVWQHSVGVFRDKDNDIRMVISNLVPTPDLDTTPLVTEEEAIGIASRDKLSNQPGNIRAVKARLYIYKGPKLVYLVTFLQNFHSWVYFVDAKTGDVIDKVNNDKYDGAVDASGVVRVTNDINQTSTVPFGLSWPGELHSTGSTGIAQECCPGASGAAGATGLSFLCAHPVYANERLG